MTIAAATVLLTGWAQPATAKITGWQLEAIKAAQAQAISTGEGVVVAVVDSGVGKHPDLEGHVLDGKSFVEEDPRRDRAGHGTDMAGQILSVAPGAKILPVQVTSGGAEFVAGPMVEGIRWAADSGAKIINVSLTGGSASDTEIEAVKYALGKGAVVIAGTGNDPSAGVGAPANLPGVVAVAGVGQDGKIWEKSATGPGTVLVAPAVDVMGITPDNPGTDPGYTKGSGTSIATALVSGVAALVAAKYPGISGPDLINRLVSTAADAGAPGRDDVYGTGLVDAEAALTKDVPHVGENPLGDPANALSGAAEDRVEQDRSLLVKLVIVPIAAIVLLGVLVLVIVLVVRGKRRRRIPPGPPGRY
ncbi:hypothetical protein Afil01_66220 [Actinorhabdospora filicis]|uniref:Peptidase S8/S53 domain-containing protein n=1 Tax=Actinorhabdospora filicis TaxID=1785913 RepID=A0A9W6WEF0_9ACTN|nr:hypothetical protein Afil01_66220 [Actinorhabdospora filicis]